MKKVVWFLQFLLVVLVSLPFALLPDRLSLRLGEYCGILLYYLWADRRRIAIMNITSALAKKAFAADVDPKSIIKQHFGNLGKSVAEITRIYFGFGEHIIKNIEMKGIEHFEKAKAKGKGIIVITGHCGNWELLGIGLAVHLGQGTVIARQQENPYLDRIIGRIREKYGNSVIYKKGALKKILRALNHGEAVAVLIDQSVVRSEGIVTEFLGTKAYSMKMPSLIARKTGAPVLPVFIHRKDGRHVIEVGEEIPLVSPDNTGSAAEKDTARFLLCLENYIRENPAEWLWIHRKWKRFLPEATSGHSS